MRKSFYLFSGFLVFISISCSQSPNTLPGESAGYGAVDYFPCYDVPPNFVGMKGIENPSIEDIMALGQLSGTLFPTLPPNTSISSASKAFSSENILDQNRLLGHAMDLWNEHSYKAASEELKGYLKKYPAGLWAGEAELHLGCYARFNSRCNEANQYFLNILFKYGNGTSSGYKNITDKAILRRVVRILASL